MGALFRSGWGGRGNRRRTAHAQEPPGLRCGVAKFARQQMGFSRDKSLERVRAEPAVAPPEAKAARMGKKSIVCARQPRARNGAACVQKNSACPKHTKRKKPARAFPEAPLPQASSVAPRPLSAPCREGKAAPPPLLPSHPAFSPSPPEIPSALTLCPCRRQTMPPDTPISFKRKKLLCS